MLIRGRQRRGHCTVEQTRCHGWHAMTPRTPRGKPPCFHREVFRVSPNQVLEVLKEHHVELVELTGLPTAEEFRLSTPRAGALPVQRAITSSQVVPAAAVVRSHQWFPLTATWRP